MDMWTLTIPVAGDENQGVYQRHWLQGYSGRENRSWTLWFPNCPRDRQDTLFQL